MKIIFSFVSLMVIAISTLAQNTFVDPAYEGQIREARQFLDSLKKEQQIPAVSIAIGMQGNIIWQEALGLSNVAQDEKATPATTFRVGSIAKSMTAIGLAILVDNNQLDWDDPMSNYIPAYGDKKYEISIRQVAGHIAGIRHYKGAEFISKKQYSSVEESLEIFRNDKLLFEPGTEYKYSTYGYVLLSRVMEVASNQAYLDFMDQTIFLPATMSMTVPENAGRDELNKSGFYKNKGTKEVMEVNLSNKWAGGGFLSTPTDLVKMMLKVNTLITETTWNDLITPQSLSNGESTGYGIGFRISKDVGRDRTIIHHGGRSMGARAFLLLLPKEQMIIAICTNTSADYDLQEVYDIAKIFTE